jgi:thioredoxin 1
MSLSNLSHFVGSFADFKKIVKETASLVVVDFFADWCGPCQDLGKRLPVIASQYPTVQFLKVNIDATPSIPGHYKVRSIPHIQFFKGFVDDEPQTVATVIGADVSAIHANIKKHV